MPGRGEDRLPYRNFLCANTRPYHNANNEYLNILIFDVDSPIIFKYSNFRMVFELSNIGDFLVFKNLKYLKVIIVDCEFGINLRNCKLN